ncbi:MAG TPA: hypothetical protein DEP41_01190, partial [Rhodobacter sp.]|nr:hypothetical protein [Rhodobacter sp.]
SSAAHRLLALVSTYAIAWSLLALKGKVIFIPDYYILYIGVRTLFFKVFIAFFKVFLQFLLGRGR